MIRLLTPDDWQSFRALRLEGLQQSPYAFAGAYEDESPRDEAVWREKLEKSRIFGWFSEGVLTGMVGYYSLQGQYLEHRGRMFGMYVQPGMRGQGVGRQLVEAVLADAIGTLEMMFCGVHDGQEEALRLYLRCGFEIWGVEPNAVKIKGRVLNCREMARPL